MPFPLLGMLCSQVFPVPQGLPPTLTAWEAGLRARQSEGIVDIGSQQWAVTTGILGSLQAPVDKADYVSHCFKGYTAQVYCQEEERSSSRSQGFLLPQGRDFRVQGAHVAIKNSGD